MDLQEICAKSNLLLAFFLYIFMVFKEFGCF